MAFGGQPARLARYQTGAWLLLARYKLVNQCQNEQHHSQLPITNTPS